MVCCNLTRAAIRRTSSGEMEDQFVPTLTPCSVVRARELKAASASRSLAEGFTTREERRSCTGGNGEAAGELAGTCGSSKCMALFEYEDQFVSMLAVELVGVRAEDEEAADV